MLHREHVEEDEILVAEAQGLVVAKVAQENAAQAQVQEFCALVRTLIVDEIEDFENEVSSKFLKTNEKFRIFTLQQKCLIMH